VKKGSWQRFVWRRTFSPLQTNRAWLIVLGKTILSQQIWLSELRNKARKSPAFGGTQQQSLAAPPLTLGEVWFCTGEDPCAFPVATDTFKNFLVVQRGSCNVSHVFIHLH